MQPSTPGGWVSNEMRLGRRAGRPDYLPAEDLVFVGGVNANYGPWLVPTSRLYDAQNTIDSSSHAKRDLLEIDAN